MSTAKKADAAVTSANATAISAVYLRRRAIPPQLLPTSHFSAARHPPTKKIT